MTGGGAAERASVRIVPGLGLDARSWTPTLQHLQVLADRTEVVLLPGYGLPADEAVDLSPAALAERVVAGTGAGLGAGPVVLVGHSSGCQVVAHAARALPGLVTAVALVGPTTDPRASRWRTLVQRWLRTAAHEDPRQVPGLVRQYAATGPATMTRAMEAARHDRVERVVEDLRCPVFVLRGGHDRICPEDWAASLGRSETLAGGGHMLPSTRGREVARWLEDLVGPGTGPPGARL